MNDQPSGIPDKLRLKFPQLRAVKSPPPLIRINGIGLGMYGRRDADPETGTYIKTHCFCFVFIPILAIGAYRVADAERGWYFIGKERLSSFAKSCNFGVLCLSLLLAGVLAESSYKSSPEYQAKAQLAHAQKALKAGQALPAANLFREVALGSTTQAEAARRGLRECFEECFTNNSPERVEAGFRVLAGLPQRLNSPEPIVPAAYQRGMTLVDKFRATNPDGAVGLFRQVAVLGGPTNTSLKDMEIELLKAAIAAIPDNTNRIVELALIYEDQKRLDLSYELLLPCRTKLGATEGARILGQHLLEQNQNEEAYLLLYPYVQARLEKLRALEQNYTNTMGTLYQRCISELKAGRGDRSFYDAYEKAPKAEQAALVEGYVRKRMENDPAFQKAVSDLTSANRIVHVALDLGMVQLNRAQSLADPVARKTELEAAEKTFLAIQGMAGDTDEYRLFLGQVYYWLGRAKEGGELFDQLLAAHSRAYPILMRLAVTLREVGEESQARALVEEGYRAAKSDKEKFAAAGLRSRLHTGLDDEIAWLDKQDPTSPETQIDLNTAHGRKALRDGNRELAAQNLRKAVGGYEHLPQTAVVLNNCGLVYLDLYSATGNIADHDRGLAMIEQALSLEPGDSVLLINIAHLFIMRAYMDVVGDALHFSALKAAPGQSMLGHLYKDEAGRTAIMDRFRQNEHTKKGVAYLDKALLLAPKNAGLYALSLQLHDMLRDAAQLQKLSERIRIASPDLAPITRDTLETYAVAKDQERLERLQNEVRRYEGLLNSPEVKDHPLTLEYAEVALDGFEQIGGQAGAAIDSQKVLERAVTTYQRLPTSAGLASLIAAHFYRAHDELKQQNPAYAALAKSTFRALSPRELFALLLDRNDALAQLIRQNSNFRKGLDLLKQEGQIFPSYRQPEEWALFRTIDADEAARVASQLKNATVDRLTDDLFFQLNPLAGTIVLRQYWTAKLNGKPEDAAAFYRQALSAGVPLPPL